MNRLVRRCHRTFRGVFPRLINTVGYYEYKQKQILKVLNSGYDSPIEPFALVHVDPNGILLYNNVFSKYTDAGAVYGGDWDENTHEFSESPKYVAISHHFKRGVPWEETHMYQNYKTILSNGDSIKGCTTERELREYYTGIDRLYESIRENGVIPNRERTATETGDLKAYLDDICVNIGRDGEFLFRGNGWHRLSIAKVLGLEEIPVRVVVRHRKWQELRDEVYNADFVEELSGRAICRLNHPDVKDLVADRTIR